jgi:uncharacterized lipoprotein
LATHLYTLVIGSGEPVMRTITAVLSLLFIFVLSACDEKTSFERQAEKDASARRAVNTGEK